MTVKISALLSRERKEFNGLDSIQAELIDQPHGTRYAVVAYEVLRVAEEIPEGVQIPTIRLTHIEPVDDGQADRVREILAERYGDRTGKSVEPDPTLFDAAGDGEREVPEASGEELLAEHREAREAGRLHAEATRVADEAEAARSGVPAAEFIGAGGAA